MATVTASNIVSRSSHVNCGLTTYGADPKATMTRIGLRNQTMSHDGLRFMNNADELHMRCRSKVAPKQAMVRGKKLEYGNSRPCALIICSSGMNLIFVGTEVGPWSKTGGLGDVLCGLPPTLAYKDAWDTNVAIDVKVGDRMEKVRFFHCYKRGVDRIFVDHPSFLEKVWGKTGSKVSGPIAGEDYQDNQFRFSLLCLAALEAPRVLTLNSSKYFLGPYGEDVVSIANDWHTALILCYLKSIYLKTEYLHS